jgi:hypothetical protein
MKIMLLGVGDTEKKVPTGLLLAGVGKPQGLAG